MSYPILPEESDRLAALRALQILDTPREERFDRIVRIAALLFNMPIALVSLVEDDRQWFKARVGLDVAETPRSSSFCTHAITRDETLVIEDAALDARFAENPLVTGEPGIRFYAGHPLKIESGYRVGTLCLIDRKPRAFTDRERSILQDLATIVQDDLNASFNAILADIREASRKAQEQLEELSAVHKAVLDSASVGIFATDAGGRLRTFNGAAEKLLGITAEQAIGTNVTRFFKPATSVAETQSTSQLATLLASAREHAESEQIFVKGDGSDLPVGLTLDILKDSGGRVTGYAGIFRDITLAKQTMEAMREAHDAARRANESKSRFVANMSHEVRTPLNGIMGVNWMLLQTPLTPHQKRLAEIVQTSAESLLTIVNDVLDFSKIEAGCMTIESINFDLALLLKEVVQLHSGRAQSRQLELKPEIRSDVPAFLKGDSFRIRQILNNLLSNAIKFSEAGAVVIAVRALERTEEMAMLHFSVQDSGIGISKEAQTRIFGAFAQADQSTTRNYGGTGLGLSICSKLVELMGGEIGVESEPGSGSTFWFAVPLGICRSEDVAPVALEVPALPKLPAMRVLLAEDSEVNKMVALHQLEVFGCKIDTVSNGREAVDAVEAVEYDFVLMDCQMPVMDGYEATAEIRRRETGRRTRIIALTAHAMAGERERCLEFGMDDYLSKPFKAADLWTVLQRTSGAKTLSEGEEPLRRSKSAQPAMNQAVFANLCAEYGGEKSASFQRLLVLIRKEIANTLEHFDEAVKDHTGDQLRRTAHKLKGTAMNLGAEPLLEACEWVETHARGPGFPEAIARVDLIRLEAGRVLEALEQPYSTVQAGEVAVHH